MTSRIRRRITVLVTPAIYSIATAAPAWAVAGTAGALWIGVTDSDGVPIGSYGLSLNNGSLADPGAAPQSMAQNWFYSAFLTIIGLAVWLIDSVLNFQWLSIIATPIDFVGRQISAIALSPAAILAVGTIAAAFIAVNVLRGNLSRAAAQIATAVVLVFLAVTVAHKPISDLVGPNGGLAMGRDIGIELSTELSGKAATGQQAVNEVTTTLADHFARTPTLVWNWGANIDNAPYNCGDIWSTAIKAGDIAEVKDKVRAGCPHGEQLHDYAMNNSTRMNVTGFFAVVFALCVLLVFGYLCYQVVILALSALFWAIVAIVALITGIIPGAAQGLAIKAALDAVFALVGMTGYVAILGITGHFTSAMFTLTGDDVVMAMPLVSLLLVALLLALRRVRGGLVAVRDRAAQAVSAFSGGTQTQSNPTGDTATAAAARSPLLNRLDPLTAVPHATDKAKKAAGTATRVGLSVAVPEAAPLIGATDQLHSRLTAQTLRKNRRDKRSEAPERPAPPPPQHSATAHTAGWGHPAASQPAAAHRQPLTPPAATTSGHRLTTPQLSATAAAPPQTSGNLSRLTTPPAAATVAAASGAEPSESSAPHDRARLAAAEIPAANTKQQVPLPLRAAPNSSGSDCPTPADSSQHHLSAPIHPAILTLARGHTPEPGADNTEATTAPPRNLRDDAMTKPVP